MNEGLPFWGQMSLLAFLALLSILSIYGRINVDFGAKCFSRISKEQIRSSKIHIFQYTVLPIIATLFYIWLLSQQYNLIG